MTGLVPRLYSLMRKNDLMELLGTCVNLTNVTYIGPYSLNRCWDTGRVKILTAIRDMYVIINAITISLVFITFLLIDPRKFDLAHQTISHHAHNR